MNKGQNSPDGGTNEKETLQILARCCGGGGDRGAAAILLGTVLRFTACSYEKKNRDQLLEETLSYLEDPANTKSFFVGWQEDGFCYYATVHKNEILLQKGLPPENGETTPTWIEFRKNDLTARKNPETAEKTLIYESNALNREDLAEKYRESASIMHEIMASDIAREYNFDSDYSTGERSKWPLLPLKITFDRSELDTKGFSQYGNVIVLRYWNSGECDHITLKWEDGSTCLTISVEDDGIAADVEYDFSDYTVIE